MAAVPGRDGSVGWVGHDPETRVVARGASEPSPTDAPEKRAATAHLEDNPLGYDVSDLDAAMRQMIDDARTGRVADAARAELARVRWRFVGR